MVWLGPFLNSSVIVVIGWGRKRKHNTKAWTRSRRRQEDDDAMRQTKKKYTAERVMKSRRRKKISAGPCRQAHLSCFSPRSTCRQRVWGNSLRNWMECSVQGRFDSFPLAAHLAVTFANFFGILLDWGAIFVTG